MPDPDLTEDLDSLERLFGYGGAGDDEIGEDGEMREAVTALVAVSIVACNRSDLEHAGDRQREAIIKERGGRAWHCDDQVCYRHPIVGVTDHRQLFAFCAGDACYVGEWTCQQRDAGSCVRTEP